MIFKDYYKILGLDTNRVSIVQIKNAYREQAKKYHPDVNVGNKISEERFKDINEAYRILSETSSKRKYDRIWNRNVTTKRSSYSYNSKNDLFTMLFGNIPEVKDLNKKNKVPCKGDNLETEIKISIEEAFKGTNKNISLRTVKGTLKTLSIKIPSGVRNNKRIRLVGQGKPGKNGGSNGDLYIKVKIANDSENLIVGNDLRKILKISPWEAVLGARVKIKVLGEDISVYIPAGTNSRKIITIDGKGYINGNGERGNLILETQIEIPEEITDLEKDLYLNLQKNSKFNPRKS